MQPKSSSFSWSPRLIMALHIDLIWLFCLLSLQILNIIRNRHDPPVAANISPAILIWDYTKLTWKSVKMRAIKYLEYRAYTAAQPLSRCSSPMELNSTVVSDKRSINHKLFRILWGNIHDDCRATCLYFISVWPQRHRMTRGLTESNFSDSHFTRICRRW